MLFMVTNRRKDKKSGRYGDEEMPNHEFEYQYEYNQGKRGKDGFKKTDQIGFEVALLRELKRLKNEHGVTPKVGIYLHGFNNDYHASIDEIFDLEKSLKAMCGYAPVIVGFSWPSTGNMAAYLSDRDEVRDSVGAFTRFLRDINNFVVRTEKECISTTFCIAHSMGNYLLRKGMEYLSDYLGNPEGRMLFSETVMIAPDLSSRDIGRSGKGKFIADFSRRVHVYYSKHDRALKASSVKRFGGDRLGRHGADDYSDLPKNVVVIDAKGFANKDSIKKLTDRAGEEVSVHSSHRYHKTILADIVEVISSVDREQIKGRKPYVENGQPMTNHFELVGTKSKKKSSSKAKS